MLRYLCTICGYAYDGDTPPEFCPQCSAPESKFKLLDGKGSSLADEHRLGLAEGIDPDISASLRREFQQECTNVGVHLAMARQADREGYPEIANAFQRVAAEGAQHAARYAELLGEMLYADTKRNLDLRIDAEFQACESKKKVATVAKQLNHDAIHDSEHEMCKDKARHHNMFQGLRNRYFD